MICIQKEFNTIKVDKLSKFKSLLKQLKDKNDQQTKQISTIEIEMVS